MAYFKYLVHFYLFTVGILPNPKHQKYEKYLKAVILTCNFTLIAGIIVAIFCAENQIYRTECSSHLLSIIFVLSVRCASFINRDELVAVAQKLCGQLEHFDHSNVIAKAEAEVKRELIRLSFFFFSLVVYICTPFVRILLQPELDYNNPDLYAVTRFFGYRHVDSFFEFIVFLIFMNFLILIDISTFWGFLIFVMSNTITFVFHIEEMGVMIYKLKDGKPNDIVHDAGTGWSEPRKAELMLKEQYEDEEQRMNDVIRYHQILHRYVKDFLDFVELPLSMVVAWFTFTTILTTVTFLHNFNIAYLTKMVSLNANLVVSFFLFCNMAEAISHLNESMLQSFYNSPWYRLRPKLRQILVIMMTLCQSSYLVKAFGMYVINLNMHIRTLKVVFSAINILLVADQIEPRFHNQLAWEMLFTKFFTHVYLLSVGIIPNEKYRKYENLLFAVLTAHNVLLVCCLISALLHAEKDIYKAQVMAVIICMVFAFFLRTLSRIQRDVLIRLKTKLEEEVSSVQSDTERFLLKKYFSILILLLITGALSFFTPLSFFVTGSELDYNDPALNAIPLLYKFWKITTFRQCILLLATQTVACFPDVIMFFAFDIFVASVMANLRAHVAEMKLRFGRVLKRAKGKAVRSIEDECECDELGEGFNNLINYQQYFHRYLTEFKNTVSLLFGPLMVWIISCEILFFFALTQVVGNPIFMLRNVAITSNCLIGFFVYCDVGETISRLNTSVLESLYTVPWYTLSAYNRKTLIMIMIQSQREFSVKVFGMYVINLDLYTRSVKIIYSAVNIMMKMKSK